MSTDKQNFQQLALTETIKNSIKISAIIDTLVNNNLISESDFNKTVNARKSLTISNISAFTRDIELQKEIIDSLQHI